MAYHYHGHPIITNTYDSVNKYRGTSKRDGIIVIKEVRESDSQRVRKSESQGVRESVSQGVRVSESQRVRESPQLP